MSRLKWDCAHELDRGVSQQAITVGEQLDNHDAEMLATRQMLSIYTRTGRADQAKAEQQKLDQLAKSSKN